MKTESEVLKVFAEDIARRITNKTIASLRKIQSGSLGDDSGLANAWDEICVQVQGERSFQWNVYDDTVRSLVSTFIDELKEHELLALWFQTDIGWDWLYDNRDKQEKEEQIICHEDIVNYLLDNYIYEKAGSWTNKRINIFLYGEE